MTTFIVGAIWGVFAGVFVTCLLSINRREDCDE